LAFRTNTTSANRGSPKEVRKTLVKLEQAYSHSGRGGHLCIFCEGFLTLVSWGPKSLGFKHYRAMFGITMCTPKKLLHRRRAFLTALRSNRPIKIRPTTHRAIGRELHDAAEEIFEKYTRLLKRPGE